MRVVDVYDDPFHKTEMFWKEVQLMSVGGYDGIFEATVKHDDGFLSHVLIDTADIKEIKHFSEL